MPDTSRGKPRVALLAALSLIVAVLAQLASSWTPAAAATGNITAPFTLGEQWYVYQGYSSGTHTGTSQYGLDLTVGASTTSTSGRTVRAPMAGTIYYWDAPYGNLCVNTANGRSYTLTHINAGRTSGSVSAGEALGTVAPAGQRNNNGVAHLHFEFWSGPGCYDQSAPIPLDTAHGLRLCGAPDLTASGPNGGNGTWSGTSFTAQSCSTGSNPIGSFDILSSPQPGTVRVRGWALDMDAKTTPIHVHVYVGGPAGASGAEGHDVLADESRPDVAAAHPGVGNDHGFDATFEADQTGSVTVYVYGINASGTGGSNALLGSRTVTVKSGSPRGHFDSVGSTIPGKIRLSAWAADPSAPTTPVTLHLYVGGPAGSAGAVGYNIGLASDSRPDVGAAYPDFGSNHGFERQVAIAQSGTLKVYLYAIDLAGTPGGNVLLGDKQVTVLPAPQPMSATAAPSVTGKPRVGKTLSASAGSWSQDGVTLAYQWLRSGKPIDAATSSTYRLAKADARHRVWVVVTAVKDGYVTATATSPATTKVKRARRHR